jgi:import inner membrane translocase subunit TIM44
LFNRFYQSWQNFKDKNPYVNKVLDWKNKYEESDNAVIRASRLLTEKVVDIMGGLFQVSIRICYLIPLSL